MKIVKESKHLIYDVFEYDVVDSTMIVVKSFPKNSIVIARQQSSGRGKGNRSWNSEDNGNLYFSLKIKADKSNLDYSQLSFLSGIALRYAIEKYNKNEDNKIFLKWPNDVLINEKKVCGILLELDTLSKDLIIGIGININKYPESAMFKATSLKDMNIIVDKYELLKEFLNNFNSLFDKWEKEGFKVLRDKWLESCYRLNQKITVNGIEGIFRDLNEDGTLILEKDDKELIFIKSGDVF